jgi:hypothetical protein
MAEKNLKARIVHKHDIEANWLLATGFTPRQGEIIVYDIDENYNYERIKIGDGSNNVNALPFVDDALRTELLAQINAVDDKVDAVSALVGDTAVSAQISSAIDEATADDFGIYVQAQEPTEAIAGDIWIDTANDPSYIPPTIPEITEADNGKVLMVVNGKLQLVNLNLSVDANGVVYM